MGSYSPPAPAAGAQSKVVTFVGDGIVNRVISFGFKPKAAFFIDNFFNGRSYTVIFNGDDVWGGGNNAANNQKFTKVGGYVTSDGINVGFLLNNTGGTLSEINTNLAEYIVIAFS